jgi:site-specific recombinase XerD
LYGSGLRLIECLCLCVQDLDFSRQEMTVREGKGDKDRLTLFPEALHAVMPATVALRALWRLCSRP